jgi:hypothetical protein
MNDKKNFDKCGQRIINNVGLYGQLIIYSNPLKTEVLLNANRLH